MNREQQHFSGLIGEGKPVTRITFQTHRQQILIVAVLKIAQHAKLTHTWQKKS
jgi:hypothetical protein